MGNFKDQIRNDLKHLTIAQVCEKYNMEFPDLFKVMKDSRRFENSKPIEAGITYYNRRYIVHKKFDGEIVLLGNFIDLNEAREFYENVESPEGRPFGDTHIVRRTNGWAVQKQIDTKYTYFGTYKSRKEARLVRDELNKHNWDKRKLPYIWEKLGVKKK